MAELAAKNGAEALDMSALTRWIDQAEADGAAEAEREKIDLVKFVLDRVGLAVLRAMTTGGPAEVAAPDAETARLLRLALAETSESRPTDRLIRITDAESRTR
ncbi:MAG: hypothetical protein RIB45_06200 [Marivibrio sp.]|uniref:hypothetical protein n=1 Tax=Marivibrio sp. TaxID=2039719 RepID=UPI0032EECA9D